MDRTLVIILSILLALLNFFGNTSETQGDLPTTTPSSSNTIIQSTTTPKPTPTKNDINIISFEAIVKIIGDKAVDAFEDLDCSYYISGDTVWIVCTYPYTRRQIINELSSDADTLKTYEELRDSVLGLSSIGVDILTESGYGNKNIAIEIGTSDGGQMILTYNKDLMFDISTYDE